MGEYGILRLKRDREVSVRKGHPWIFSGAVEELRDVTSNGQSVVVRTFSGEPLGVAAVSLSSQIRARMWSFDPEERIDDEFFSTRLKVSIEKRNRLQIHHHTDAFRLVNAESDGLPGLIVDRYAGFVVCQFLSAGAERWRRAITEAIRQEISPTGIYERSDSDSRLKENLEKRTGNLFGEAPGDFVVITEFGIKYFVDIMGGHKTGFYLDQRDNRELVRALADNAAVLNCFSYTGGFGFAALAGNAAHVINIDSSVASLDIAVKNLKLNGFEESRFSVVNGDVFQLLRKYRDSGMSFDIVILDPPKFAESVSQVQKAARGYKDINLLAMKLIRPGGYLVTFSCSGHVVPEFFTKIVADAAVDSGRNVQQLRMLQQASDHPVVLNFPESLYLKGLACRIW